MRFFTPRRPLPMPAAAPAAAAALHRLGRLTPPTTALFVCDVQERFRAGVQGFAAVADTAGRLAAAAGVFGLPVLVVTEQVPDKLGATVAEVAARLPAGTPPALAKHDFSMVVPAVEARLAAAPAVTSVVITGIEAHVCVLQTTLDLIERGYAVHLAVDGISSQRHVDREAGLARAAAAGAHLSTSEMILFELARSAAAPAFREVSALAKEPRAGGVVLPGLHGGAAVTSAKL